MGARALALGAPAAAVILAVGISAAPARAHTGAPVRPDEVWAAWSWEPGVLLTIGAAAWLYARGIGALWRRAGVGRGIARWRLHCFAGGLATLFVALVSPLDAMGGALFSAHMVQHELLMLIAAPLLVLGSPTIALVWALPDRWRRRAGRLANTPAVRAVRALGHPAAAWVIYAVALWVWHLPALYQATLRSEVAHVAQHSSFLAASLLFWSVLLHPGRSRRSGYGWGIPYLFTTGVHGSGLAALLTFSREPWYPVYAASTPAWGLTPLEDQQLAGVIMWVPPGFLYVVATVVVMGLWLRAMEHGRREGPGATIPAVGPGGDAPRDGAPTGVLRALALAALLLAASGCDDPGDPGPVPPLVYGGDAATGKSLIRAYGCGTCHTIPGVRGAKGLVGPPLTSFAHRTYIAGSVTNTPENLVAWIVRPQSIEPGTAMPTIGVDEARARHIAAYLYTLR